MLNYNWVDRIGSVEKGKFARPDRGRGESADRHHRDAARAVRDEGRLGGEAGERTLEEWVRLKPDATAQGVANAKFARRADARSWQPAGRAGSRAKGDAAQDHAALRLRLRAC